MISKGNTSLPIATIQGRGVWRLKLTNKRSALCWCLMSFTRMRLTQMRWRWPMVWLESQLRPAANGPSVAVAWVLGPVQQRQLKSPACPVQKMNLMTDRRNWKLLELSDIIGMFIALMYLANCAICSNFVRFSCQIFDLFRYLLPNGWWLFLPNCFSKDQLKVQSKLIKLQYLISPDLCVFIWRFDLDDLVVETLEGWKAKVFVKMAPESAQSVHHTWPRRELECPCEHPPCTERQ